MQPKRAAIPRQLHALIPAMLASFARRQRRCGLPRGMLASAVLQLQDVMAIIAQHQAQRRMAAGVYTFDAITSDYEAEFMVGPRLP